MKRGQAVARRSVEEVPPFRILEVPLWMLDTAGICCGRAKINGNSLGTGQTAFASEAARKNGPASATPAANHELSTQSRFAAVRVRPAHRDYWKAEPHAEEWLPDRRWPRGEAEPTKYWISTLPSDIKLKVLIKMAKHRWIIERDYEELKQRVRTGSLRRKVVTGEVFHHHATRFA